MRLAAACLILAALAAAPSAAAPPASPAPAAPPPAAASARAAELADQDRRSEALNTAENQKHAEIQAHNDAAKAAYEKALAEHATAMAQAMRPA